MYTPLERGEMEESVYYTSRISEESKYKLWYISRDIMHCVSIFLLQQLIPTQVSLLQQVSVIVAVYIWCVHSCCLP